MMKKCQNFLTGNSGDLNFFQLLQIFLKFAVLLSWKMGFFLHFQGKYCRYHFERFQALSLLQNTCQMEKLVVDMVTHKFDEKFKTRRDFFYGKIVGQTKYSFFLFDEFLWWWKMMMMFQINFLIYRTLLSCTSDLGG